MENSVQDQLKTMFNMQEALNVHTNGPDYKETKICAKTGKPIDYRMCAWMEAGEFIGSFDWKHWKHGKNDIENAKTELVDIWHFLMGMELIENGAPTDNTIENLSKYIAHPDVAEQNQNFDMLYLQTSIFPLTKEFAAHVLNESSNLTKLGNDTGIFNDFVRLCFATGLSFNELFQRYIIKNTLNKFRQDNGYAEGTYTKIWAWGEEDNVFAVKFATALAQNLTSENLYGVLDYFYKVTLPEFDCFSGLTEEEAQAILSNVGMSIKLSGGTNFIDRNGSPAELSFPSASHVDTIVVGNK
ncbi:MAG: dUTP diphosphatase [Campylobacterales bacterium]|nr:dUTP diphosphatase [Campylobacterales bacterium]